MSRKFQLAAEELKRFRQQFANVFEVAEALAAMEDPADLEANIARLKTESLALIARYRTEAERQAAENMKARIEANEENIRTRYVDAVNHCDTLKREATAEAEKIVADARKAAEELKKKFDAAHAHLQT